MSFRRSVQGGLGWTRSAVPAFGSEYRVARPLLRYSNAALPNNVDLQPSRAFSSVSGASGSQRPQAGRISIKAGVLFAGLSAFAVVLTTYGVWDYFAAFRVWPKELREPLRAALKAKNHGKFGRSAAKFREALEIARKMDTGALGSDYLLKVTGIAIALGDALELDHKPEEAANVYLDALNLVTQRGVYAEETPVLRSPEERMRGVSLAQKLGDLAVQGVNLPPWDDGTEHKTQSPAEGYLSWSVSELMRLMQANASSQSDSVMLSDLHLPSWVTTQEIGGSVEALGAFYASHDIAEYAVPLYLQAISLLMPVKGAPSDSRRKPTAAERCRAAVLMNNISQVLAQGKRPAIPSDAIKPSAEPLDQAMAWAAKGLDLATLTSYRSGFLSELPEEEQVWLLKFSGLDPGKVGQVAATIEAQSQERLQQVRNQCLGTQFVLLYNLGMYNEMKGDMDAAKTLFSRAMRQADLLGLREARSQCARSLRRINRT